MYYIMGNNSEENYGIVYALTNPAMPGLVKIGMTSRERVKERMRELYLGASGVPQKFECIYAGKVQNVAKIEKILHKTFGYARINPKREFFEVDSDDVKELLELIAPNEVEKEVNKELDADISKEEKDSAERMKKRAAFNFEKMGIPIGAKLTFVKENSTSIEVVEGNKVKYGDEIMSLTRVTKLFLPYVVHPTPYWIYQGDNLADLWEKSLQ